MNQSLARTAPKSSLECSPGQRVTRSLLGYGVIAGPLYVLSVIVQGLTRRGFDLTRDDASLLSNGSLGWIQIATFVVTGLMVITFALGVDRALGEGRGSTWGPRLIGLFGLGLIGAGLFVADPMNGFPPGAPLGHPQTITLHGILHLVAAGIGFVGLIAACFVLGSRFARESRPTWAWYSRLTGLIFLLGFMGLASGSSSQVVVLGFWIALLLAWSWIAALGVSLYRGVGASHEV